jgi:hypothetical protein
VDSTAPAPPTTATASAAAKGRMRDLGDVMVMLLRS